MDLVSPGLQANPRKSYVMNEDSPNQEFKSSVNRVDVPTPSFNRVSIFDKNKRFFVLRSDISKN